MKQVIILRGLSGSGKSTVAETIRQSVKHTCLVLSADDYLTVNGVYSWSVEKMRDAHDYCFRTFATTVMAGEINMIVVDNVNREIRDYSKYMIMAELCGYEVVLLEIACVDGQTMEFFHARSKHNIPISTAQNMWAKWETDPRAKLLTVTKTVTQN